MLKYETRHMNILGVVLFIGCALLSLVGAQFSGHLQNILWEFSSMMCIAAYAVMVAILSRDHHALVSAGFNLLIVGEGFVIATSANPEHLDLAAFGAALVMYIPGFLLIGIYSRFTWWTRAACILLCVPFGIELFYYLNGTKLEWITMINYCGYTLRTIAFVGWIIALIKMKDGSKIY